MNARPPKGKAPVDIDFDKIPQRTSSSAAKLLQKLYQINPEAMQHYAKGEHHVSDLAFQLSHSILIRPSGKTKGQGCVDIQENHIGDGSATNVYLAKTFHLASDGIFPGKHLRVFKEKRNDYYDTENFKRWVSREVDISNYVGLKTKPPYFYADGNTAIILQRKVEGITFDAFIEQCRRTPISSVLFFKIVIASLRALAALHTKANIVHADLHCANLMIHLEAETAMVSLIDLEQGRREEEPIPYNANPFFTAPECHSTGDPKQDRLLRHTKKTDVYALGKILSLLCGGRTNKIRGIFELSYRHIADLTMLDRVKINCVLDALTHENPDVRLAPSEVADKLEAYLCVRQAEPATTHQMRSHTS